MTLAITRDQTHAITAAAQWFAQRPGRPFKIFGPAGTGKTHIAREIADHCAPGHTVFIAPTGKATHVLRTKGCEAQTIHSAIYIPAGQRKTQIDAALQLLEQLHANPRPDTQAIAAVEKRIKQLRAPSWALREADQAFGGTKPQLIVVDEASMVPATIAADIAKFGVPTAALGDPYQLPPVRATDSGYLAPADATLTAIHRYGDTAALVDLATAARREKPLPAWDGTAGVFGGTYRVDHLTRFEQVIVGTNDTRWRLINALRARDSRIPGVPEPGDRIMAIRNDPTHDVVNGQQATVAGAEPAPGGWEILTTDNTVWPVDERGLIDAAGEQAAKHDRDSELVAATFAQAITCHKAQGSQWDSVAVVDESRTFRGDAAKWLYTAATRATSQCIVLTRRPPW